MSDYEFTLPIYGVIKPSKKAKNPSLTINWYRNAHYRTSNDAKKRFKAMIQDQLDQFEAINGQIRLTYIYYAKRKGTDMDNFVSASKKFFQDALVESGLLIDDNTDYIIESRERFGGIDKDNPRIVAKINVVD